MKILLIFSLSFGLLFANNNRDKYDLAYTLYKNKEYTESKKLLNELADEKYSNIFIYFLLGRVNRALGNHDEAIKYLKKYKSYDITPKNLVAADINLAYEYLQSQTNKDYKYRRAVLIVNNLINLEDLELFDETLWKDIKNCYAIVYNNYGYYLLYKGIVEKKNVEHFEFAAVMLNKSLYINDKATPVINNLLNTYIQIRNIYKNNGDIKNYNKYNKVIKSFVEKYEIDKNEKNCC